VSDATRSRHVSSSLQKPTVMNSSDRRVLRFWPQRPSRRRTHSSKLHFTKSIDRRVGCSAPPRLSPPPLQAEARVVRQMRLSSPRPHLSPFVAVSVALVATSVAPEAVSIALRGHVCRPHGRVCRSVRRRPPGAKTVITPSSELRFR
jgi:hypothetical protein